MVMPIGSAQQPQSESQVTKSEYKPIEKSEYKPVERTEFKPTETSEGTKAISEEAIKKNIENLKELLSARQTNVTLEYDELSSPKLVNIVDAESGDILKRMPPEGVVELAEKARDYIIGMIIDKKV